MLNILNIPYYMNTSSNYNMLIFVYSNYYQN